MKHIFLIISFCIAVFSCTSQNRINRYRHKQRQGRWIIYQDSTNKIIDNTGRYRKGEPKGTWKYYDQKGTLIKKEKHFLEKVSITEYYPSGKIYKRGKAKTVIEEQYIHYFYYGDWYVYDTNGIPETKLFYDKGTRTSEKSLKPKVSGIDDSLVEVVRQMNISFYRYSDSLQYAENKFGKSSKEYQRFISLNNLSALKILEDIDKLISKFGYPGRTLVGKDYAIVFSIISAANLQYKEKYLNVIVNAADTKELDWTDVAFFIDKIKVAKKEPQIYGTQYKITGTELLYYPIIDKSNLNVRRNKAGLDEMDISLINDTQNYN